MQTLQTNSHTQMTLHEKRAWFNLAIFALALTGSGALSAWGLCGLIAFNPYLYRTIYLSHRSKRLHSEIFMDERDISIRQRANLIAFHAFYAVCILVWAGLWATHREYAIFSIDRVIKLPLAALLLVIFVESLATVVQYGGEK